MCGIFGIWQHRDRPIDTKAVERATTTLRHRGPDDEGYLLVDTSTNSIESCGGRSSAAGFGLPRLEKFESKRFDLAFGFRRLSILDLSAAGHQPMASADSRCWIVYNGEIYNYLELKKELTCCGYEFRSACDTEVILAAYQRWGVDCLSRFKGMWAFALLDLEHRHLLLARDRFGIKPLYYTTDDGKFIFASEIKALLSVDQRKTRQVNPQRLYDYLNYGLADYGDETMFAGIRQLSPAHYLILRFDNTDQPCARRYWQVDLSLQLDLSLEEASARLRELFLESVRLHLRSDVPVGTALSGGIDSSAIVMSMRHLNERQEIHAFSYVADDATLTEEHWVDVVGAASHAIVHKVRPQPEELVADLDGLISTQDEPFNSTSIYAQYRVFALAREAGIKVMLDGQGADEMLAGYRFYLPARLASLFRQRQWAEAASFITRAAKLPDVKGLGVAATSGGMLLPPRLRVLLKRATGNGSWPSWLNRGWFVNHGVEPRAYRRSHSLRLLQEQLHESLVESSLPVLLRYEDRNSMAHSIESRVPFLTSDITEFVLALPEKYLISQNGTSKSVFRQAMRGIVPDNVLDRKDKIGFATPEYRWLSWLRPWVDQVLHSDEAAQIPPLNLPAIKREWAAVLEGSRPFEFRVWRWLNVIRWSKALNVTF